MSLLEITDLKVGFDTEDGLVQAVRDISLTLDEGEILALCGESGCGKSVTAMSIPGCCRPPRRGCPARSSWTAAS
ncbi:ATP-binding cassette domain-containing protein [Nonomuraea thailandensis]